MPGALLIVAVGVLLLLVRILHLASQAAPPNLCYRPSSFNESILQQCSLLFDTYVPPLLWGKSGHLQTIVYGKMGRINSPFPNGERCLVKLPDGATMSYDVFEPTVQHPSGGDYTLLICPGLANSSESLYICTCVHYAQTNGFRVAVQNHIGVPKAVPLTSDRIFNYGSTLEYDEMFRGIRDKYPQTQCIPVGFSMGGNLVLKWLSEKPDQEQVLAAISCCQGYSASKAAEHLMSWEHFRRVYFWAMTMHKKGLLRRHQDILFSPSQEERYPGMNEKRVWSATSLLELDRYYTAPRLSFTDEKDYYEWTSCCNIIHKIRVPMLLLNALDDPIVPQDLHNIPRQTALSKDNVIFATTAHGGHLGFFEGGLLYPDTITWLDKIVVQYANAIVNTLGGSKVRDEGEKPVMEVEPLLKPISPKAISPPDEELRKRHPFKEDLLDNYVFVGDKKNFTGVDEDDDNIVDGLKLDITVPLAEKM